MDSAADKREKKEISPDQQAETQENPVQAMETEEFSSSRSATEKDDAEMQEKQKEEEEAIDHGGDGEEDEEWTQIADAMSNKERKAFAKLKPTVKTLLSLKHDVALADLLADRCNSSSAAAARDSRLAILRNQKIRRKLLIRRVLEVYFREQHFQDYCDSRSRSALHFCPRIRPAKKLLRSLIGRQETHDVPAENRRAALNS